MSTILHKGENCNFTQSPIVPLPIKPKRNCGQTLFFDNPPAIIGRYSVVGEKEGRGPLGGYFDKVVNDAKWGEKTFERGEINMLMTAIRGAIGDAALSEKEIELLITGDLLNQLTSSNYVARELDMPHIGLYSACSTMTEALAVGAAFLNAGYFDNVACATVSHFATAERQFRFPLEYGCQRPPYAQRTVTGAGCSVLSARGNGPKIVSATLGKVIDYGSNDLNNLGAAMAPAAMSTLSALLKDTDSAPDEYDLIITGDLGKLGSDILRDLMSDEGYALGQNYIDCGNMIYDITQNCYQGGSGAGCSATVFNSFVFGKLASGEYSRVAYLATGALMSTQSCYQGETIPCISHGIVIEKGV